MMNYYNSLGNRRGSVLNFQEPEVVGNAPNSSFGSRTSWFVILMLFISLLGVQKITAQTYFTESFENDWYVNGDGVTAATAAGINAPSGWTQLRLTNNVVPVACSGGAHDWGQSTWSAGTTWSSTSSYPTGCSPYGGPPTSPPAGTKALWFYDGNTSGSSTRLIATPSINLASSTSPIISFSYSYAGSAVVTLVGSLDGGTTWNTLNTIASTTSGVWVSKIVAIPVAYKIATAKFGYQIVSSYGSYDVFIDNVAVREGVAPTAAPITFSATLPTATSMTLNWVDDSTNETGFRVYRSTDNITFTKVGADIASTSVATTGTAYTSAQTGLTPGITYYYRIVSFVEVESSNLTGTQATLAAATYYYVGGPTGDIATGTNWNTLDDNTGANRTTPTTTDILIVDGAGTTAGSAVTLTMAAAASIGSLQITSNTPVVLQSTTTTSRTLTLTGAAGNTFGIEAGSSLSLNNATLPAAIVFSTGTGMVGTIAGTLNFGGSTSNLLTTTGGTGTLVTVTPTGVVNLGAAGNSLIGSATTLSFAAGSNCNSTGATTGAPPVPLATWATTSNLTISGLTTSTTTATNNNQSFGNFTFNCPLLSGTFNFFGANTQIIKGDLTIIAAGATGGTGIFRATSTGAITVNGNILISQGRFQAATTGSVIANTNTTVGVNGILDTASSTGTFSQRGATLTNNGILTGVTGTLQFVNFTGSFAQTLAGSGTVLTNLATLSMQNTAGLTISHTNQIIIARANLFQGTITNSNKITFGTGLAVACTTQIGSAGLATPGGSFSGVPTFNLGTGVYNVLYAQESVARTSGDEIPSTRTVSAINVSNSNGLTIAGGALATGTLTFSALSGGNITTSSSNLLTVTGTTTGSIVRTLATAYVNGPLALTLPASLASGSTYTFPIGKGTLNTFALVNPTTNAGGTVTIKAEAFDATTGGTASGTVDSIATNRYWAASITAGSANFTNSFIQLNDTTTGFDAIAESATLAGAYTLTGGPGITSTPTSLTSNTPASTILPGFYVMGVKAAPTLASVAASPAGNQCTNVARTITADVTPSGAAITTVVLNYSVNGVAQTPIAMTNTTGNGGLLLDIWSGTIPTVTPTNATIVWSVTATDGNTLFKKSSDTTYNDEPLTGVTALATASVSTTCAGTPTILNAVLTKAGGTAIVGTATTLTSATSQPTAFCNRWPSYRMQLVYTAAELQAAGLGAGNITSLAFNIASLGDAATNTSFVVMMGSTALSALTAFLPTTGFTTVYPSATFTHTATGWQTIPFSTPYNWDGTSNIVIDFVHNGADATNNSTTYYTATAGNTVAYTATASSNSASLSTNRLNVTFTGVGSVPISSVSWSDGISTVGTTNGLSVSPTATTTYTATITLNGCSTTANTSVTVNLLPTAPVATASTQCGAQVPTASVSDPNGYTGPIFNWYADNVTTTALQTGTFNTFQTSITATTTYYVSIKNPTTLCESARTAVTVTVTAPQAITLSTAATVASCLGNGTTVVASSLNTGYTYSWTASPQTGSGISGTVTGASQTFTPTALGTYTYTVIGTDGICTATTQVTVTINVVPSAVVASPVTNCTNVISALTATGGSISNFAILSQNFNGATNDWTTTNSSTGGTPANIAWTLASSPFAYSSYGPFSSNDASQFYLSNNDNGGSGSAANTALTSPSFSTVNFTDAKVSFWHYFRSAGTAKVDYSIDGGTTWTTVQTFTTTTGAPTAFVQENIILPAGALNQSNVQVRFKYDTTSWQYFWMLDNVVVSGTQNTSIVWSPTTNLFTDAAATIAYTGTSASTVYVKSATAGSQTYTVTATSTLGCSSTSTVDVTTNALPTVVTVAPAAVCSPTTVDLTTAAVTTGSDTGLTFTYFTNAAATTALATPSAVTASGTYYIKGTNASGCSSVTAVVVVVNPLPTVVTVAPAAVCTGTTVDITASTITTGSDAGLTFTYFTDAAATTALATPAAVTASGTYYIKGTNANGCSAITSVVVTINITPTPTGTSSQTFCGSANLAQLVVTGTAIRWYTAATGGTEYPNALLSSIGLVNGTTYYASQTLNGCESPIRFAVTAVINPIPSAPNATPQTFCTAPLVANLVPTGAAFTWYDASTGGAVLNPTAPLSTGTYYVSQTINGCESIRTAVSVTVNVTATPTASAQTFCGSGTVANLVASGASLKWYTALTGGTALASTTALATGTYYVSQTVAGCESTRTSVAVTVNVTATPTATSPQSINDPGTIANIAVTGTAVVWYPTSADAIAGTNALVSTTPLVDNTTYYATQTIGGCTSTPTAVLVNVVLRNDSFDTASLSYYPNPVADVLNISYTMAISKIEVYNLLGQIVKTVQPNQLTTQVDMSGLPTASYLVQVTSEGKSTIIKIVKK